MVQILTLQVRSISSSIQAIGQGDFSRKVQVESQGETLVLKETINHVIDSLMVVVTDVIKLGKDTALEGALGGQVNVDQLQGMWKTMVDYTNSMAYSTYSPSKIPPHPRSFVGGCHMDPSDTLQTPTIYVSQP